MRTSLAPLARATAGLALMASASAFADDVRIFTDTAHPATAVPGATIIELDAPARLVSELGGGLPVDPQRAEAVMRQRLANPTLAERQKRIGQAFQAVADAYSLGVAKLPAVVVEGRYVVYGDADTRRALGRIAAYRRAGQ
ncbi:TIGR03757 family integrating conjugative element protein [Acidovorax sp. SUPP2539]|uniref:TIGR03757 family integrating conjugative element protein n=1 Tax=Acidovorax sp. SUPP2539 TaxID=2920878 RepID=UPI0023DE3075|nr:TIGR03757 family integrating conjugative element protein [Acidovorax sp. SUPP2539]GKS92256.1 TIGR03757 family integrating conjugative element protein [Acidovorax sp. SUPP2539]